MSVGPPYCRSKMYAGRIACCLPGESRWACQRDSQTDRQTNRCITLSVIYYLRGQRGHRRHDV